jgi:HlyD family secretion protein
MLRTVAVLFLLAFALAVGWFARDYYRPTSPDSAKNNAPLNTAHVVRGRMEQNVKARGIVKPAPSALVRVGFPMPKDVARRINKLSVIPGDSVTAGQDLVQLNFEDLTATKEQLIAESKVFGSRIEALKSLQPIEVHLAETLLTENEAQLVLAQSNYDRVAKLTGQKTTTQQELDAAINALKVARAKLDHAKTALEQVKAKFRTDISTLEAQVEQSKAAIANTDVQIEWSTLRSPINGQVFAVHQQKGELTSNQPNAPVLTLLDTNALQVHLYVDESDFGRIKVGQSVNFRIDSYPDRTFEGKIVRLLPQPILQENVVYYLAVVEVDEQQRSLLRSEMTVLAHVQAGINDKALWLPVAAVRSRPEGWYVVRPDRTETPVQIGWKEEGRVEIREGLREGDEVLLEP